MVESEARNLGALDALAQLRQRLIERHRREREVVSPAPTAAPEQPAPTLAREPTPAPAEAVLPAGATRPEAGPGLPRVERPLEPPPSQAVEAVVAQEVQGVLQEKAQAPELSAAERQRLEKILNNKNLLDKAAEFAYKKLKGEKFAGIPLDFAVSFAGTAAVRLATRKILESAFSITGGAVTGAIIGAGFRGFREWRKAVKEQYSATSWLKDLEGKDGLELAQLHQAVSQAIEQNKVRGSEEEARALILRLRDIESKIQAQKIDNSKPLEVVTGQVLGIREQALGMTELEGRRKDLYQEMLQTRRKQVLWKVAKGAGKGALIGAAGGALAEYAAEQIKDWLEEGKEAAVATPEAAELARQTKEQALAGMAEKVEEAEKAALLQAVRKGIDDLPNQIFEINAQAGEGLTHISRNAIHDYLVQLQQFGIEPTAEMKLDQAQLVYAEDWLRREIEQVEIVQPGEEFKIKGELIAKALGKAQSLSEQELTNLKENWVGKIGERTWQKIMDYSQPFNEANNFSQVVHDKAIVAEEQAAAQVKKAAEAVAAGAKKLAAEKAGEAVEKVGRTAKDERTLKYILGTVLGVGAAAAAGFTAYRYREKIAGVFGGATDALRQRITQARESRPRVPATPEQKGKVKEGEAEKLAADPILQFVEAHGWKPKQGDIEYQAIVPGDLGKDKAGSLSLSNYSDYRRHLEQMSPYQRVKALQYSNTGLLATDGFWKKVDGLSEEDQKKWEQLRRQIKSGRVEDKYTGKPEVRPVARDEAETRRNNMEHEYGMQFYPDYFADDDGNDYALVRLVEVLAKLPKERLKAKKFQPSLNNSLEEDGIIKFNPDAKPEELQEFLTREALDKADKIADLDRQADQIKYQLYRTKNVNNIVPMVHGEKYLQGVRSLKEAAESLDLPPTLDIYLFDPATRESSDKYLYLGYDLSPGEMRAVIEKYLTQQASKENK